MKLEWTVQSVDNKVVCFGCFSSCHTMKNG